MLELQTDLCSKRTRGDCKDYRTQWSLELQMKDDKEECHPQVRFTMWLTEPMEIEWRHTCIHTLLKYCLDNCKWHIGRLVGNRNRKAICNS